MSQEFENLSQPERDIMYSLPVYVAILIAGADGKIDNKEVSKALNLANDKLKNARKELINYYTEANDNFEDKFKMAIANLPSNTSERQKVLANKLKESNEVFGKLPNKYAISLYSSLKEIAKKIAEASGGVLGYMAIDYEESKLIELKMIKDPSNQ